MATRRTAKSGANGGRPKGRDERGRRGGERRVTRTEDCECIPAYEQIVVPAPAKCEKGTRFWSTAVEGTCQEEKGRTCVTGGMKTFVIVHEYECDGVIEELGVRRCMYHPTGKEDKIKVEQCRRG